MKINKMYFSIFLIISILILFYITIFFITPKLEFSENENRYLQKTPIFSFDSLISGEYIEDLEKYLTDHFPYRDEFMGFKTNVLKFLGQNKFNGIYLGDEGYMLEEYNILPETSSIPIDTLNTFYSNLKDANVEIMLVPTSLEIYSEYLPKYAEVTSQKDVIDFVYNALDFKGVNVYDILKEKSTQYDLYYRLDHHWTTYGAYLAYLEYIKDKDVVEVSNPDFNMVSDEFYGTFYSKVNDYTVSPDKIYAIEQTSNFEIFDVANNKKTTSFYYNEWLDKKDKYSYFLDNNQPLLEIRNLSVTEENKGKSIAIIKDSYANCFVPIIANNFEFIYVIDPRFYRLSISEYINEKNIEEVLLIYNMKTIDTDTGIRNIK